MVHSLNAQTGADLIPAVKLLPGANAKVVGSTFVNNVLYVGTADECGGVPNGVYAIDLTPVAPPPAAAPAPGGPPVLPTAPNLTPASTTVASWQTRGGSVVGFGPALGSDGIVYVATADGDQSATAFSDAVVALENRALAMKDYFTPGKTPFTTSPLIFQYKGRDLVVAVNKDGRLYVLDAASLGGSDHKTPLHKSVQYTNGLGDFAAGALSTFEEADGTRWVVVASAGPVHADAKYPVSNGTVTNGAISAFKVTDASGAVTLQPAWVSRDMTSPVTPTIVNGVVFAIASGENVQVPAAQRAQRSTNAVLYALDAQTGKELWNSGTTITSFVHGVGPAADDSQVYVMTYDGTLYTFGWVVER
jgi:outer membrane protein assembly factor BamB